MKRKIIKLTLVSLIGTLDILIIAAQILITTTNFKWSPSYDPENIMGMVLLLGYPKVWGIILSLLFMNFIIKEMNVNGKLLLASIGTYIIFLFVFDYITAVFWNRPYFFTIVDTSLIVIIVVYALIAITILISIIKVFSKAIKER